MSPDHVIFSNIYIITMLAVILYIYIVQSCLIWMYCMCVLFEKWSNKNKLVFFLFPSSLF